MLAPSGGRTPVRRAAAAVVLALSLTGCASMEPPLADPAGVDSLVVPTPTLEPADLVADAGGIDHPWLAPDADPGGEPEGEEGLLVQDDRGHVWLEPPGGGEAGLWLPAEPRRGDGWVVVPGAEPRVASVLETEPDLVVELTGDGRPTTTWTYRRGEGLLAATVAGGG